MQSKHYNPEIYKSAIIDIRAEEMAAQAAQFMIDLLEERTIDKPQLLIPPKLVVGEE